jgi:putative salt-induced outer membrane protein YdiY
LVLPLLVLVSISARAEDTVTNDGGWGGGAEFNANISKGNTNIETLGAAAEIDYKAAPLNTSLKGDYMRNRTDEVERARRIGAALRTGFNITNNVDFFALGTFMQDRFRGIEHAWMVTPGLGIYVVNNDMFSMRLEGALGYMTEEYYPFTDTHSDFLVGTAGTGIRIKLTDVADLTDDFLWIDHLSEGRDWRLQNTAAISSRMSKVLSLKISQNTLYRKIPVAFHQQTDNYTSAAIVLKF